MSAAKKKKPTQTTAFIAAVGAFVAAGVGLLGYLMEWSPATYPLVLAFVGAGLAVRRSGLGLPPDKRGYTRIEVLGSLVLGIVTLGIFVAALSLITGCSVVTHDNPSNVAFDFNRKTCAMWVDVDNKRAFEINPGPATKCGVKVTP